MATYLTIPVTSDTLAELTDQSVAQGHNDVVRAGALALKRGLQLPEGRFIPLAPHQIERLEAILSGGSLLNGDDLVRKTERLAGISFLHVRLPFTPGQLEDLQVRAERQGLTVEQLVERAAGRIYEQFFNLIRT